MSVVGEKNGCDLYYRALMAKASEVIGLTLLDSVARAFERVICFFENKVDVIGAYYLTWHKAGAVFDNLSKRLSVSWHLFWHGLPNHYWCRRAEKRLGEGCRKC